MIYRLLIALSVLPFNALFAQIPSFIISLSSDSILYNNAPFHFNNFIDARYDTTKLGLLKETESASRNQQIVFPTKPSIYLHSYINSVVTHIDSAENVTVVIKKLSIFEEPMGAIEVAKVDVVLEFYLEQNEQFKLIKAVQYHQDFPDRDVTPALKAQMEKAIRRTFFIFLTQPSTEGESNNWHNKAEFTQLIIPIKRLSTSSVGELKYVQNRFLLNGSSISKKEAIKLLQATKDIEINKLLKKHKLNSTLSFVLSSGAVAFIVYPIGKYIRDEAELNPMLILAGSICTIGSLLAAKTKRNYMHKAVNLFNERYNS